MATAAERWIEEQARLVKPAKIYWCDGSEGEAWRLLEIGMNEEKLNGPVFRQLNQKAWPTAYLHRSNPSDVARVEHLTFVCQPQEVMSGPNNNWMDPAKAKKILTRLSDGCMKGRTMYVIPYMMGHPDSPYAKACLMFTDSTYVAVSMRIMTRIGTAILKKIGGREDFIKGFHSIGDLNPERRYITHFPQESLVWSIGSGYGGNALLGKKCVSLRLASYLGYQQGWLAEHMVIMGIEDHRGNITYVTAALPSACGKTNLAMMESALPGYKIWTLGDDIAWLNVGPDGRLWAINPEAGFFGVAPGTSTKTNPNMMRTIKRGGFNPTLFTNVALDLDRNEPWWEGLGPPPSKNMLDWKGNPWPNGSDAKAAHPNSRFTASIINSPMLSKEYENPQGVPISAIIFGARRTRLVPLVVESLGWANGVFVGARMGSETTAAATGKVGVVRRDPMAMRPFCGYNMADYWGHWLKMERRLTRPPKIFSVNWFRVDEQGKFIWPGFGDNIRVLKWVIERVNGKAGGRETPVGIVPRLEDLDLSGITVPREKLEKLFEVDMGEWAGEVRDIRESLKPYGRRLPSEIRAEYDKLARQVR
jgi:phosphoenolpyruvate carboxykinase (GTP)